jgi:MoxR-like ATPase
MSYDYTKVFDAAAQGPNEWHPAEKTQAADRRDGRIYRYTPDIELAVNVALVTRRPLLVRGRSGCGKSSLARNVANKLGRRYYEFVVTSHIQAADFLYKVDLVRRLNDAKGKEDLPEELFEYVEPGVLWWAFDPGSAKTRGATKEEADTLSIKALADPAMRPDRGPGEDAVVLIDEIDKADPDVPNDLLVPFGSSQFCVPEIGRTITTGRQPFLILTSNEERSLSPAFLRRCVELTIPSPTISDLVDIGELHFGDQGVKDLLSKIAAISDAPEKSTQESDPLGLNSPGPSVAEFLDLAWACIELGIPPDKVSETWNKVHRIVVDQRNTF